MFIEDFKLTYETFPELLPPGIWRLDHDFITTSDNNQIDERIITVQTYFELESII